MASVASTYSLRALITSPLLTNIVSVNEDKVFLQLENKEEDHRQWVLDTGATNHMTDSRPSFTELDMGIIGNVKFGNKSVVEIEGRDNLFFTCKTEEHHVLTGVYYIPKLTANNVSLDQLDETGCKVIIDNGMLFIYDQRCDLLANIKRSPN